MEFSFRFSGFFVTLAEGFRLCLGKNVVAVCCQAYCSV